MATRIRNSQAIPNVLRYLAPIVAWTIASFALGIVLGFSAVILPPMGAFGIVVVAGLVLLRVMPRPAHGSNRSGISESARF